MEVVTTLSIMVDAIACQTTKHVVGHDDVVYAFVRDDGLLMARQVMRIMPNSVLIVMQSNNTYQDDSNLSSITTTTRMTTHLLLVVAMTMSTMMTTACNSPRGGPSCHRFARCYCS